MTRSYCVSWRRVISHKKEAHLNDPDPAMAVVADSSVVEILCEVHFAHLTSALKELAISGVLTDITFVCEDGTLQAHQVVVSAFSGSLRQISSSSGHKSCVFIINAKKKIVQALLHFLYQGYTCISKHEFEALTEAASTLKLDCFTQTQLEYVDDNLYLRFPDHERLLRENLQCLRSSHNLCDVVFVTEELSRVYSHACIMATCSRMLQSVLMSHRRNNDGPCVLVLEGVKLEHILPILDFCYHGSASMTQEIVCETHCVARLMEMDYICEILATVDDPLSITTNVSSPKSQVTNTVRLMDMISEPGNGRDSFRNFQRILSHLASTESLTDVTFLKDGRCLRAHSVLLCAFGPYFKELEEKLGHDLKEAVVLVRSLSGSLLQSYLDYLYRGEAQFSGSPKEFCELMSNWIDFSLLPADDSTLLPCDGISAEKTCEVLGLSLDNISCVVELSEEFDLGRDAVLIQGNNETVELVPHQVSRHVAEGNQECKKTEDNLTQWVELTTLKVEEGDACSSAKGTLNVVPRVCKLCKAEFTSLVDFKRHFATHPETKWVTCNHCKKTFSTTGELRVHMRSHTELRPFQCNVCNKQFAARNVLRKHRLTHDNDPAKAYRCSTCSKSFMRREYFHEHLRTHSGTKPFKCPTCGKGFVGRTGLNHHIKTHTNPDERRNWVCEVCGKYFTRHALWTHTKTHKKVHTCTTCGKSCATPAALKVHVQGMHLGEREHTCHICAKSFNERRHLLRHIRAHDQDKDYRYLCSICSRIFKTEDQLKKHSLLNHKSPGDLPYSCEICHKSFAGRSTLIYHRRSHTGERPHTCLMCGKSFSRPDALKKHECSCREEDPVHKCPHCEKTFCDTGAKKEHIRLHHKDASQGKTEILTKVYSGSRPFRCLVCRKSFRYQDSLDKHAKMHVTKLDTEVSAVPDHDYTSETLVDSSSLENDSLPHAAAPSEQLGSSGKKTRQQFTITIDGNLTCSEEDKMVDSNTVVIADSAGTFTQNPQTLTWHVPQ